MPSHIPKSRDDILWPNDKKTLRELWKTVDNLEMVTAPKNLAIKINRSAVKDSNIMDIMETNQGIQHNLHNMEEDDINEIVQDKKTPTLHDKEQNTIQDVINDVIQSTKDDITLATPSKINIKKKQEKNMGET